MNKKVHTHIFATILKSILLILLTAVTAAFSRYLFVDNMFGQEYFSEQVLNIWYMVFFLLIFNSFVFAIKQNDEYIYERFRKYDTTNKLIFHMKFIGSSGDFYVEIGSILVLSLILPERFLYGFVAKIFFYEIELTTFYYKLYTLLIILPIMFILILVDRIIIQKKWYLAIQKENETIKKKSAKNSPIVKRIVAIAIIYCGVSMSIPWLFPILITLWNLGGVMLYVWIAVALVAFILFTVIMYYIRALLKRIFWVKKLKSFCDVNCVYISDIKNPYISVFFSQNGVDFSIQKNGFKYDCKFIAGIFPGSQIVFSDDGKGIKQDIVRVFGTEVFRFITKFDFGFECEGKKIVVLLPTPKKFFVSTNQSPPRLADVGEKVGSYTIYNSTGFLGALDRNCLE